MGYTIKPLTINKIIQVGDYLVDRDGDYILILAVEGNGKGLVLRTNRVIGINLEVSDFDPEESLWRDGVKIWPK